MKTFLPLLTIIALIAFGSAICAGQNVSKESSALISGRVSIAGVGTADITVIVMTPNAYDRKILGRAVTDKDGNYIISGVPSGRVVITPAARAYAKVFAANAPNQIGRSLNISAGDEITNIDFALVRGGVITGRITDASGSAIIGEPVTILPVETPSDVDVSTVFSGIANHTDDRGIYRSYGLAPGMYKVSVGQGKTNGVSGLNGGGAAYVQTFYPGATDEAKATLIEVKAGAEVKDIDIRTTRAARGFSVSGRVVDAITEQPAANVYIGYSVVDDSTEHFSGMSFSAVTSDVNGKFTLSGLPPGRYAAFTVSLGVDNSTYSEPAKFEVLDGDVSGVEIKISRGATIEGVAVVENSQDPAVIALLQTVGLYAFGERKGGLSFARSKISANGTFKFTGLAPGKARISLMGFSKPPKGLTLVRTEVNGVAQGDGIEVTAGAEIKDVRLILAYAGGSIRGTIRFKEPIPEGTVFHLTLTPLSAELRRFSQGIEVDSRGRFTVEDLLPGPYELTLHAILGRMELPGFVPVKKTITITNDNETQVTFEVELNTPKGGSN